MTIMSLDHSLTDIQSICKNLMIQQIVCANNSALQLVKIWNNGPHNHK
jgi:hypothetical protein